MAGLPAAQGDQRLAIAAVAAEEPKKSRKQRPAEGDDSSIDNPDEGEQENLGNKYKCRFCNQWFQKSQALGGHMNKHRQEREQETIHKAQVLISDMQHRHMPVSTQGYVNMYGQLSATEIAQRSSGMQARGAQSYHGMPATASYYHSTANTSFVATQHFSPLMPTNSSNNHVQQQNPGDVQPWNIDNTMSSNQNHGPRAASAYANELMQILHDSSPSTPPINEYYH